MLTADKVLNFWFGSLDQPDCFPKEKAGRWFGGGEKVDCLIRDEFLPYFEAYDKGELEYWRASPHGCLALIVLLDQFSRNIYRDTPSAFAHDARALSLCQEGRESGFDLKLFPVERAFFYMPLMHAEDVELQEESVSCFKTLLDESPSALQEDLQVWYDEALRHQDLIVRFGRYPHRNMILGRPHTEEERMHLEGKKADAPET